MFSFRSLSRLVAHSLVHQRRHWLAATCVLLVASSLVIVMRLKLDTEVLNLLPTQYRSIQALKIYNSEFAQARQLTFAITDPDPDRVEAFSDYVLQQLPRQPWVLRYFDRAPFETPEGIAALQEVAVPLLLNLPDDRFQSTLELLQPEKITRRFARLRTEIDAGSPKAGVELSLDPLGVMTRAMEPLASVANSENRDALLSDDGTMRVFFVEARQKDIGAIECQKLMATVHEFIAQARRNFPGGKAPELLVTGRSAYVSEISLGMHSDLFGSVGSSVLMVCGLFYLGFRRLTPLFGIVFIMLVACVVSVAAGTLIFGSLNMITIGFCSILIGLGVDFGMLHFSCHEEALRLNPDNEAAIEKAFHEVFPSVLYGSLTTAVAFMPLLLSHAPGFGQMGMLVAVGVLVCAVLMSTVLYNFLPSKPRPVLRDVFSWITDRYVDAVIPPKTGRPSGKFVLFALLLLLGLTLWAFLPLQRLVFDADPASLEPRNSLASVALHQIKEKMPAAREPILAVARGRDAEDFHRIWNDAVQRWTPLVGQGLIRSFSTPAAFAMSPARLQTNWKLLHQINFAASREALTAAIATQNLSPEALQPAFTLLDHLEKTAAVSPALPDWHQAIPENSAWWFLIDRYLADDTLLGTAFLQLEEPITNLAQRDELAKALDVPGHRIDLTGWHYGLVDLISWADKEVYLLAGIVGGLVVLLLGASHRRWDAWILSVLALTFSTCALVASLKLLNIHLNILNILSFSLVLGVDVNYGIHALVALRQPGDQREHLWLVTKPIILCALTTVIGFVSLITCNNPALRGLGVVCTLGVSWSLLSTLFFLIPAYVWKNR